MVFICFFLCYWKVEADGLYSDWLKTNSNTLYIPIKLLLLHCIGSKALIKRKSDEESASSAHGDLVVN
ncbi:hypothetical protein VSA01S_23170 [Vibrio sagamiensis NBRC 104589]|uniref:Uncharacterized protein n=1 Tax=Vibrio sagamiensis NBRC 104589 TaxID=1219064 RepID=A0A511QFY0_9VIBR|nr:hypothetical protein VSA01S_23170 [Vibrio sagamiensis NBRC 104589]